MARKKLFENAEEMQKKIDEYFEKCRGKPLLDRDGDIVKDKYGVEIIIGQVPPTITGLALFLGFNSRQSLLNYQANRQFFDTITRAKSRVEEYTEQRLFDREGVNGAKFSLINNFKGWSEKNEVELSGEQVKIIDDIKTKA